MAVKIAFLHGTRALEKDIFSEGRPQANRQQCC